MHYPSPPTPQQLWELCTLTFAHDKKNCPHLHPPSLRGHSQRLRFVGDEGSVNPRRYINPAPLPRPET